MGANVLRFAACLLALGFVGGCAARASKQPAPRADDDEMVATLVRVREGWARAAVNVPLRWGDWDGKGGAVVGFVRRGVMVETTRSDGRLAVLSEFPTVPRDGVLREGVSQPLHAWIDEKIAKSAEPRELAAQGGEVMYGLYRELSAEPGGKPFAFVKCGRVVVLERHRQSMRVAADYPSGELHGWVDEAAPGERDPGCDAARGLPHGYAEFFGMRSAFKGLEDRQIAIHRRGGVGCDTWRFETTTEGKRLVRRAEGDKPRGEYQYWHIDGALGLAGPYWQTSTGWITSSATETYRIVDMNEREAFALSVGHVQDGEPAILAYRVSVLERWFLTLEGCLAAAK